MLPKVNGLILLLIALNILGVAALICSARFFNLELGIFIVGAAAYFYYIGLGVCYIGISLICLLNILRKKESPKYRKLMVAIILSIAISIPIIMGMILIYKNN